MTPVRGTSIHVVIDVHVVTLKVLMSTGHKDSVVHTEGAAAVLPNEC